MTSGQIVGVGGLCCFRLRGRQDSRSSGVVAVESSDCGSVHLRALELFGDFRFRHGRAPSAPASGNIFWSGESCRLELVPFLGRDRLNLCTSMRCRQSIPKVLFAMDPYRIWKDVDELAFHENNIILELLGRSQGTAPPKLLNSRNPVTNDGHSDGLERVPNLLDDFALVAAGAGGASNVAAACLELNQILGKRFVIRIAKNEDFSFTQLQCLKDIVIVMNRVKQGGEHVKWA